MRSAPACLLLAAFWLLTSTLSSGQHIDPQSGAVCEPKPSKMSAVREMAEAGDAVAEYEVGRSMLGPTPTEYEVAAAMPWFRRSAERDTLLLSTSTATCFVKDGGRIRNSWFIGGRKQRNKAKSALSYGWA